MMILHSISDSMMAYHTLSGIGNRSI